jgi:hypothetical protein
MALVLSHWSETWAYSSPKSLMVYEIQRSWEQQLVAATVGDRPRGPLKRWGNPHLNSCIKWTRPNHAGN